GGRERQPGVGQAGSITGVAWGRPVPGEPSVPAPGAGRARLDDQFGPEALAGFRLGEGGRRQLGAGPVVEVVEEEANRVVALGTGPFPRLGQRLAGAEPRRAPGPAGPV